jgi:hypothetical protein
MSDPIQSLWWGRLSAMERLCAASYIANGHPFHLYTYGPDPTDLPDGVELEDANEVAPQSRMADFPSVAQFSDFFRYKLLLERGGWWVDMDSVCLRPFDFAAEYVLVRHIRQPPGDFELVISNGYMKFPPGSPVMKWALEQCRMADRSKLAWETLGPKLITQAMWKFSLKWEPSGLFLPIPWWEWGKILEAAAPPLPEDAYAVHLWNTEWSRARMNKDATYAPESLYEQLKRRYAAAMGRC